MEFKELVKKEPAMLHQLLAELREKHHELKFKVANNQLKNIREIRSLKKNIARILLLLKMKKTAGITKASTSDIK